MIPKEKITEQMLIDRALIIAIVSCNAIEVVKEHYAEWLDDNGFIPYYEMVIEIVDELMFTEGSEYLKYAEAEDKEDWFIYNHDTCFDWYFLNEANKLVHERLK